MKKKKEIKRTAQIREITLLGNTSPSLLASHLSLESEMVTWFWFFHSNRFLPAFGCQTQLNLLDFWLLAYPHAPLQKQHTHTHTPSHSHMHVHTQKHDCKDSLILWGILAQLHRTGRDLCASGAATLCAWHNWRTAWWTHDQKGHSASTCWTQWPERRVWKTEKHCCQHPVASLCN